MNARFSARPKPRIVTTPSRNDAKQSWSTSSLHIRVSFHLIAGFATPIRPSLSRISSSPRSLIT